LSSRSCRSLTSIPAAKRFHVDLAVSSAGIASTSRGLVGDTNFAVLPDITPLHCFILTGLTQVVRAASLFRLLQHPVKFLQADSTKVQLIPLWRRPSYKAFLQAIAACGFSSFMFGWHVHEKAVMLVLVPLRRVQRTRRDWRLGPQIR
jgi:alpha-1,3-glucosyltransferase